ncbi:MAG: hypothetical protein K2M69_09535 [Muribaculaceae bacterium]|nr:hypothetical protein [Muribaculaceae bacterium]
MGKVNVQRRIAIPNFYGENEPIYKDQLGWQEAEKKEAGSLVSKEIWDYFVCLVGLNISFYFPENDTYYGLHTEEVPYTLYELPRDKSRSPYIGLQCSGDTHEKGKPLFEAENREDLWNGIRIDGHSLEYVLNHSYILKLD